MQLGEIVINIDLACPNQIRGSIMREGCVYLAAVYVTSCGDLSLIIVCLTLTAAYSTDYTVKAKALRLPGSGNSYVTVLYL